MRDAFVRAMPVKARVWCGRWTCHQCGPAQAEPDLFFCVMCPDAHEWVGDYDASDYLGECPKCRSGVGVFAVEHDFPRRGSPSARRIGIVSATRTWDTLDADAARWLERAA